jgi:acyl-CoA synthetase (AMP-forming)/AMP-acid ligase II
MSELPTVVARLAETVERAPDATVLVAGDTRIRYADLWSRVAAVATSLNHQGLRPGDRVALLLENSFDYVAAYYGALAAGATAVAFDHAARAYEVEAWLKHCGALWLFADPGHPDIGQLADMRRTCRIIARDSATARTFPWPTEADVGSFRPVLVQAQDPAAIIYTSGTTGRPKGVVLTHGNISANTAAIADYLQLTSDDRVMNVLPFFYSYGSSVLHTHLWVGATIILENSMAFPQRVLARMVEERVTGFPGVPSTFAMVFHSADVRGFDLRALRYLTQAGGAMSKERILRLRDALPHARVFVMYGQTEATARLTYLPPERLEEKLGSVGIPIQNVEVRICDEQGTPLPPSVVGEVCVRGPNVMAGYHNDPEASAVSLRGGWLHTGDTGYVDADGFLYLEGRRSDMIKTGAHRISPSEIEEVIAALPAVADVAVVGVADDLLGETIKAVVALREGASIDELTVKRHCIQHLPKYKVPRVVEFVVCLPRTTSGKIMRYRLTGNGPRDDSESRTA